MYLHICILSVAHTFEYLLIKFVLHSTLLQLVLQPFYGPLDFVLVCWYQKGKTNLDFTKARDSEWQYHHLGLMQICT